MRGLAFLLSALMAAGVSAATLENEKVRVEIGARGELASLVCKATGHDWAGGAPLWRLYFDDKRGGHEEKEVPVLGAEQAPQLTADGSKIVLDYPTLVCRGKPFDASLRLTVTLEPNGLVRFASELSNREAHTCIRELQYPLVGDCRLPKDAELLTTFLGGERFRDPVGKIAREGNEPPYFGRTWEFRQVDCKYPSHTVANCFAFLNEREGLYLGSHDPTFQDTWHGLRVYPDGPMSFTRLETGLYKYPDVRCSETWRALLRKMVDRAIDFGADSVFFDQLGYCEYTSTWKTDGEFPMPDRFIIAEKAETLRMLHDYMDAKAPRDFAIGTECFVDVCAQHVDYVHNLINPSKPTDFSDWMRYAFPEVPVTDREIRDDTDVAWRVNHNLLLGLRTDGETFRCQRTLDGAPAHRSGSGRSTRCGGSIPS